MGWSSLEFFSLNFGLCCVEGGFDPQTHTKKLNNGQQHQEEGDRAQKHCSKRGQRPAVAGPDVRLDPTRTPRRCFAFFPLCKICFIVKMRRRYLPLKQRQPKRAAGATMLMLSGALTSPSHCKEAAPCDSHGAALPPVCSLSRFSRLSTFGRCVGKKPTASYLLTSTSAL